MLTETGMKLGIVSANCSSGFVGAKVAKHWSGSWEDNLEMARLADVGGLDFLLPLASWNGSEGDEGVLEPIAWAAGLLSQTKRLSILATIHTAFHHPLVIANQMATLDQISKGRAGLNIVAGWAESEHKAFGVDLPKSHDARYALAQEWFDIILRLWTEPGSWDYHGKYFNLLGAAGDPKPVAGPLPIFNASAAPQGRRFATINANYVFTPFTDTTTAERVVHEVTTAAHAHQRHVGVLTPSHVVCQPTREGAKDFYRWYSEVEPLMIQDGRRRFADGQSSYPLVGTPDDVADELEKIYRAGIKGTAMTFFNYVEELPLFLDEVLPRLEKKGIRKARPVH